MPLEFDISKLEPMGADGDMIAPSMLTTLIAYSTAISMKRIADALEREDIRTVVAEPENIEEPMIMLRSTLKPATAEPEPQIKGKTLPAGFTPHDNSPTAPIDRNREVMVFHANGKQRKGFGGAIVWATKPNDPWRVLGWKDLGDGATNGGGTDG